MNLFALVAAFGGGVFGAAIGGLYAFVMTGFMAIAGAVAAMAGGADLAVGSIAFGSYFGPHIAFVGGVAAAAFAANKKKLIDGGADIVSPLNGTADASVLVVGGVFGVLGFLIQYVYGTVLGLNTDTVAMTVATCGILCRFIFGSTGLVGKYEGSGPRTWITGGKGLVYNIVLGASVGLMVGGVGVSLINQVGMENAALITANFPSICFGIAAVTLILAEFGLAGPTTHHIALPAANAAVLCAVKYNNLWMGVIMGVVWGIITSLVGDFMGNAFNSHCDSHIDPPAMTIFSMTFIIFALFS
ncbi:MAG: hypothetical protein Q4B70_02360 [Lachnospiraceae bacterium]|nr:hypothetical protein [Lachnospiraceae bacterium]